MRHIYPCSPNNNIHVIIKEIGDTRVVRLFSEEPPPNILKEKEGEHVHHMLVGVDVFDDEEAN